MLKAGLVGLGTMGTGHFFSYREVKNAKLVGVADIRYDEMAQKLKNFESDTPLYSTMEELIEKEHPDVIDIVTPTYTHADLAVKAMEMGCHVICEKPMALTDEECERMLECSRRTGKRFMIAHVVRFMAPYMYLKNVIDTGSMGKLQRLFMTRYSAIPRNSYENWMQDVSKSGGAIIDISIHDIDFVRYMFGDPKEIQALHYTLKDETNYGSIQYVYDGFTVTTEGGWYRAWIPFNVGYTAIFENGIVTAKGDDVFVGGNQVEIKADMPELSIGSETETLDGYAKEIQYFIDCIENNKEIEIAPPESARETIALCNRIIREAKEI